MARGNGEGSIVYHKHSKRYMGAYTVNGTRKYIYGKTRKEVKDKLNIALNQIQVGTYKEKTKKTLLEILKEIVQDRYDSNKTGESAYNTNLRTIERIKKDNIASKQIQKITIEDLNKYFNSLTDKYSNSVIRKNFGLINASFRRAVARGYIHTNPFDNKEELQRPKSKKTDKKVKALTVIEQQKLLEGLNTYDDIVYKNVITLALFTGMRCGEILALKLNDIDLSSKVIHINKTLTRDIKGNVVMGKEAKTQASKRDLRINLNIEKILKSAMENYRPNSNNLLFCRNNGELITQGMMNSVFKRLCKKCGISINEGANFHMLRHTYATRCIESGMPAKVLQKKLGHQNISVTLNTYTDIFSAYEDKYDEQQENYLKEQGIGLL